VCCEVELCAADRDDSPEQAFPAGAFSEIRRAEALNCGDSSAEWQPKSPDCGDGTGDNGMFNATENR